MFGIGFSEMVVILIVALLVVGPDKLPELAKSLAKGVNELRSAMNQIKESLNEETKSISSVKDELRQAAGQMKDKLLAADELGGTPHRPPVSEEIKAEIEADLDSLQARPWEQNTAEAALQETDDNSSAAEERIVGKNPALPAA